MKQLPETFLESLQLIYTKEELEIVEKGFSTEKRNTSFRINTLIPQSSEVLSRLEEEGIPVLENKGIKNSYILKNLDDSEKLWKLDLVKRGHIYLQGISSQLPVHLFDLKPGMKILDLASSPGGKTCQIAELLENTGEILALDNNEIRIDKLKFTLERQGTKNTRVLKTDARKYHEIHGGEIFDAILFDAPCSAEGRVNLTNEKSYGFISNGNNKKNYYLQRDILKANIALLKEGGELIYSTCTISPLENEGIVHFLLCNFPELEICDLNTEIFGELPTKAGLTHFGKTAYKGEVAKSIRVLPCSQTEGFFIAKFIKKIES